MPKTRHIPERSCVACGKKMPKADLVRFVRTPHGAVSMDSTGKSPGRGAYFCSSPGCWNRGLAKGGLERSLGIEFTDQDRDHVQSLFLSMAQDLHLETDQELATT